MEERGSLTQREAVIWKKGLENPSFERFFLSKGALTLVN